MTTFGFWCRALLLLLGVTFSATMVRAQEDSDGKIPLDAVLSMAQEGNPYAQTLVGYHLLKDTENGPADWNRAKKAATWFTAAARQGNAMAQCELSRLYLTGFGVPQSSQIAKDWAHAAALQDYAPAQTFLGMFYTYGFGAPRDVNLALKWLQLAAKQEEAMALQTLGEIYAYAHDVPQDDAQAVQWMRRAAELDLPSAQDLFSGMVKAGMGGLTPSAEEAVTWYRKAAEGDDKEAQLALAEACASGEGTPQAYEEAVAWYRKAADQGEAEAFVALGLLATIGQGMERSEEAATAAFDQARRMGNTTCTLIRPFLAAHAVQSADGLVRAAQSVRTKADAGDAEAQTLFGLLLLHKWGTSGSYEEAARYFRLAAAQDHAFARYQLAKLTFAGLGTPRSLEQGAALLRQAAEGGIPEAQWMLSYHLQSGELASPYDPEEGFQWLLKAVSQDNAEACFNLGYCYRVGIGTPTNLDESRKWFHRAADLGFTQAKDELRGFP